MKHRKDSQNESNQSNIFFLNASAGHIMDQKVHLQKIDGKVKYSLPYEYFDF